MVAAPIEHPKPGQGIPHRNDRWHLAEKRAHALTELPPDAISSRVRARSNKSLIAEPVRTMVTSSSARSGAKSRSLPSETTKAGTCQPTAWRIRRRVAANHVIGVNSQPSCERAKSPRRT